MKWRTLLVALGITEFFKSGQTSSRLPLYVGGWLLCVGLILAWAFLRSGRYDGGVNVGGGLLAFVMIAVALALLLTKGRMPLSVAVGLLLLGAGLFAGWEAWIAVDVICGWLVVVLMAAGLMLLLKPWRYFTK